jgi:hypothetical protein
MHLRWFFTWASFLEYLLFALFALFVLFVLPLNGLFYLNVSLREPSGTRLRFDLLKDFSAFNPLVL